MSLDRLICNFDRTLRVLTGLSSARRPNPAAQLPEPDLSLEEKRHSAGLMRVNHVGEVCAQALYQAQATFASDERTKQQLIAAGEEELDHLAWTAERLQELGSRPSWLNPLWYAGAYTLGMVAAKLGDKTSLGFVVETERQVEAHLGSHLTSLPLADTRSRAIVATMQAEEQAHGAAAMAQGAGALPAPVQQAMQAMSKVMTRTAYYI